MLNHDPPCQITNNSQPSNAYRHALAGAFSSGRGVNLDSYYSGSTNELFPLQPAPDLSRGHLHCLCLAYFQAHFSSGAFLSVVVPWMEVYRGFFAEARIRSSLFLFCTRTATGRQNGTIFYHP